MRATLIYNSSAGQGSPSLQELKQALGEAGFEVSYQPTEHEDDLDAVLADPGEVVVVAGGDGTVGAVASRLVGRKVALSPLPLGTANNIGSTLGLKAPALELIRGLRRPNKRRFDVGSVKGSWGESVFFEAVGVGLFAQMMANYASEEDKTPGRALRLLTEALEETSAQAYSITLDGHDLSGDYLLVEAMNIHSLGPRVVLAPEADPSNGLLELVLSAESDRSALRDYLHARLEGKVAQPPALTVRRGKTLTLSWSGIPLHVDDRVIMRTKDAMAGGEAQPAEESVTIVVEDKALELWLPRWPEGK